MDLQVSECAGFLFQNPWSFRFFPPTPFLKHGFAIPRTSALECFCAGRSISAFFLIAMLRSCSSFRDILRFARLVPCVLANFTCLRPVVDIVFLNGFGKVLHSSLLLFHIFLFQFFQFGRGSLGCFSDLLLEAFSGWGGSLFFSSSRVFLLALLFFFFLRLP